MHGRAEMLFMGGVVAMANDEITMYLRRLDMPYRSLLHLKP